MKFLQKLGKALEISNVGAVMDGNIDPFINAYLSMDAEAQKGKKE